MNLILSIKKHVNSILIKINQEAKFNQTLIERKGRITTRSSLSELEKQMQVHRFHQKIITNFSQMENELKKTRLMLAREYHHLKRSGVSSAELRMIAQLSKKLQQLSHDIELKKSLYLAPKAPTASPLAASLPKVPAHKVALDEKTLKSFVDMSIKVSWHVAETAMRQYVQDFNKRLIRGAHPIRLEDVKSQVCDELIKLKHLDIFGQLPKDVSHDDAPRMRR